VADVTPTSRSRAGFVETLARRRVPIGFLCGVGALWLAQPTHATLLYGVPIGCVGEWLRIWAAGHLEKGREVTMTGPYRFTRHPLYLGSTIMGIGLAVAANSVAVAVAVALYLAVTLTAAIRTEERHLTSKFGGEYPAYREGTAAPIPRRFSLARAARNREYRALIGFLIVVAALAVKAVA
jgi:protein-S-isoprenylcysteine O-methyltransferase Ste14